jgi:hypothetical protein
VRASDKLQILRAELVELNGQFVDWCKTVPAREGLASLENELQFLETYVARMRKAMRRGPALNLHARP